MRKKEFDMQRIHPDFVTGIYENIKKGNTAMGITKALDAVQYWMDTLTQEIGPLSKAEMPLVIAAMKNIVAAYDKLAPGSENAAGNLVKGMDILAVIAPHGR